MCCQPELQTQLDEARAAVLALRDALSVAVKQGHEEGAQWTDATYKLLADTESYEQHR